MLTIIMLATASSHASTWTETFGNLQTSGCSAQWYGGTCETGQTAAGVSDSLGMCYASGPNYGVVAKPSSLVGGFGTNLGIPSGAEQITITAKIQVLANDSDGRLQLIYRNSGGTAIATSSATQEMDIGVYKMSMSESVPSAAASVDIAVIGVGAGTEFWVDSVAVEDEPQPTDADCGDRAEVVRIAKYNACYNEGGIPTGTCDGEADATMLGGCKITCILGCFYPEDDEEELVCPSGF